MEKPLRLLPVISLIVAFALVPTLDAQLAVPESSPAASAQGVPGEGLVGHWQGSLRATPVIELRLVLEITESPDGGLAGQLVSVDQGNSRIPLTGVSERDGAVRIDAAGIGANFEGTLSPDGSELSGQWRQGGGERPLEFRRLAEAPSFGRRQDPVPPYPYAARDAMFENASAGIMLAGTFTRPEGDGPHPAVVLISGSGPQDRDEALMGHRPFLVLADHLTRRGIAVLRYDDRGVGRSTGDFRAATHDDFVSDALAAVAWLKDRPGIDPARIGLVGHSEGGVAAPLAAVKQPDDIAFMVLMAAPGVPMGELLTRQSTDIARAMGASPELLADSVESQRETLDLLRQDLEPADLETRLLALVQTQLARLTEEQRKAFGFNEAMVDAQVQMVMTPWFRHLLEYDPQTTLGQVTCPVLAINGGRDLQVAAEPNLDGIGAALAAGGNTDVTIRSFPELNHLFQTAVTGSPAEYGSIEETFNPEVLETISGWIRQHTGLD